MQIVHENNGLLSSVTEDSRICVHVFNVQSFAVLLRPVLYVASK